VEILIPIALVAVGIALIVAEVYLVPGFNVVGIVGMLVILFAVGFAFAETGWVGGVTTLAGSSIVLVGTFTWLYQSGAWDQFVLSANLRSHPADTARENDQRARYLGRDGLAITPLRPTGVVEVDGERIEVTTEGEFVAAGSSVKVVAMDRRRYFVRLA
jgi:membrane-bound serine protease (ClpP class)